MGFEKDVRVMDNSDPRHSRSNAGLIWLGLAILGFVSGSWAFAQSGGPASPQVSGERAWQHLETQVDFGPRVPGTPGHRQALTYLTQSLRDSGGRVSIDRFESTLNGRRYPMANIYADFGPAGDPVAMLAAHWDTRPIADQDPLPSNRTKPIPGANDGASGVAVLLEIARILGDSPPSFTTRIALWDGEDLGMSDETMFYGSRHYVRTKPLPQWGILLDMVGDRDLEIPKEFHSANRAPALMDKIWAAARHEGFARYFPERLGHAVSDDHLPFLDKGVPFVNLIDFDYPSWHTMADTPERCSPESLAIVGNVVLRVLGR